ncbi:MAG: LysR family transcriptional regulator [Pseudomonadota bacterium]
MEPDYRQLMYLLAIARRGTFSGAAQDLRMSQPALSNSIALLEDRLQTAVLRRGRSGAVLTDAGRVLVRHAEQLEVQMKRAVEEIGFHRQAFEGPLNVGVTPVAAANLVPRALAQLRRERPRLVVRVQETVFREGVDDLLKGTMDVMVGPIGVYAPVPGIAEKPLMIDPFSIVVRSGHPLAGKASASLRRLKDCDWVLPSDQSAFHRQLEALFVVAGIGWPNHAITTNSMIAMKSIVINSDCVALMPKQLVTIEQRAGLIKTIRLVEAGASRALGISWAEDREPTEPAKTFMRTLQGCIKRSHS